MVRVKICGITDVDQAIAIAHLGATTLGFICVTSSPRYITASAIRQIVDHLPVEPTVDRIGVFANAAIAEIQTIVETANLTGIQLHGSESPQFCQTLQQTIPHIEILKAFRIKDPTKLLEQVQAYLGHINTLLLDAYHPEQMGGTGLTIDWQQLRQFRPPCPWFLAGGLTPENIHIALQETHPDGIDVSSGVEQSPGQKDLAKVAHLFKQLATLT